MKKSFLTETESANLSTICVRIEEAMRNKGIHSFAELNKAIKEKRGDCPSISIYSKMKWPPRLNQEFYNVSGEYLLIFADILGVSTDYLLGLEQEK